MKDQIKDAIARGEAAHQAAKVTAEQEARARAEEDRRKEAQLTAEYRRVADRWVESNLAARIEAATACGERFLDVTKIAGDMKPWCRDETLAAAIRATGVHIESTTHEHCDYETGRGEGTYYNTYKATW